MRKSLDATLGANESGNDATEYEVLNIVCERSLRLIIPICLCFNICRACAILETQFNRNNCTSTRSSNLSNLPQTPCVWSYCKSLSVNRDFITAGFNP